MKQKIITVRLRGGLGNQMFQYAYGRKVSLRDMAALKLDKSLLQRRLRQILIGTTPREYELGEFNIKAELTKRANKNYLDGFWQSEKYFKDIRNILLKDFTLKKKTPNFLKIKKLIVEGNSVSVHIRRGDYVKRAVTRKYHGILDLSYYYEAVKLIGDKIKKIHIFVFSDDPVWVKENFKTEYPVTYVSGNFRLTNPEELILMSLSSHSIIANSSFSWWGAWLNKNPHKIIIAPKRWFKAKVKGDNDIVPKGWVKI
jgi:hypothetical protein